jgi:thymidylate kinase
VDLRKLTQTEEILDKMLDFNETPIALPPWLFEIITHGNGECLELKDFKDWYKNQKRIKIALEGLPGAGKTSILNSLCKQKDICLLQQFEVAIDAKIDDQLQYINNDVFKSCLTQKTSSRICVLDRDFTSTLAFNYAKSRMNGSAEYSSLLTRYKEMLGTELVLLDIYVYLRLTPELSIARKKREQDSIWSNPEFLTYLKEFYDDYFDYLKHIAFVVEINTADESLEKAIKHVKKIIRGLR